MKMLEFVFRNQIGSLPFECEATEPQQIQEVQEYYQKLGVKIRV